MYEGTGRYKCCVCGKIFDEPIEQFEYSEYWGAGGWTGYWVSPCCKEPFDELPDDDDEEECEDAV